MPSKVETSRETTRTLNASQSRRLHVDHTGWAASLLFLEKAFNPRNTQMNANGKEFVLYFAKLSECDTSSCRFGFNAALDEKQCEDAAHSKALRAKAFSIRVNPCSSWATEFPKAV